MYWPWWQSGLALASIAVGNWFVTGRQLAVSGRFTALVNRARQGSAQAAEAEMSAEELVEAMRELTRQELGEEAVTQAAAPEPAPTLRHTATSAEHVLFLVALAVGGFASAALAGPIAPSFALRSSLFPAIFGGASGADASVLLLGGALVGFGTRMAAGCTSGHGLCGVSRLQKGSLLATCAFFGAGIVASLALGVLQ